MRLIGAIHSRDGHTDGASLRLSPFVVLLVFAALIRWIAYTGYFGSDEVTYTEAAFRLLDGDWSVSNYVGANRYGVNLPVAVFASIFGRGEAAAAGYSFLCSLAEVALVAWFGARILGERSGLIAGLVLATLPIHVHYAGRLMADAPLALAVTASFLFFWDGEVRRSSLSYFIAGLAAGWSFWIKPATAFYLGVFLTYPLFVRRVDVRWGFMAAGLGLALLFNGLLFLGLTGRFWFAFENMAERAASGYLESELAAGTMRNDPGWYLTLLFGNVPHSWLLGYFALAGVLVGLQRRSHAESSAQSDSLPFVMWWAGGLLVILSIFVVKVSPLIFVPKQTNYVLMFVAPLSLLAGAALASLRIGLQHMLIAVTIVPAIVLGLLLQASIMVFTANSKAIPLLVNKHPDATIYANTNGYRLGQFRALVEPSGRQPDIRSIGDWTKIVAPGPVPRERLAVIDTETLSWGTREPFRRLEDRPACWIPLGTLEPIVEGIGPRMVQLMARLADGSSIGQGVADRLERLSTPRPAYVFRIPDTGC